MGAEEGECHNHTKRWASLGKKERPSGAVLRWAFLGLKAVPTSEESVSALVAWGESAPSCVPVVATSTRTRRRTAGGLGGVAWETLLWGDWGRGAIREGLGGVSQTHRGHEAREPIPTRLSVVPSAAGVSELEMGRCVFLLRVTLKRALCSEVGEWKKAEGVRFERAVTCNCLSRCIPSALVSTLSLAVFQKQTSPGFVPGHAYKKPVFLLRNILTFL